MSHRDGANRDLAERLRAQGYRFASAMENVAVGYGSVDAVVEAWLESAGHCRNLMNPNFKTMGSGIARSSSSRTWYATENFR